LVAEDGAMLGDGGEGSSGRIASVVRERMLSRMAGKMSSPLEVLTEIRDELKDHGRRLGALERRQSESEIRLATELVNVARAVTEVRDRLRERLDDRDRIDALERRIAAVEHRLPSA
jgi:hypothetical protein